MGSDTETHPASVGHASKHSSLWSRPSIPVKQTMPTSSHPACKPVLQLTQNISHQNERKNVLPLNSAIKLCTSFTTMRLKVQNHSYSTCRHTSVLLTALQLVTNAFGSAFEFRHMEEANVTCYLLQDEWGGYRPGGEGAPYTNILLHPHPLPGL